MTTEFARELATRHGAYAHAFPPIPRVRAFLDELLGLLLPHFAEEGRYGSAEEIAAGFVRLRRVLAQLLAPLASRTPTRVEEVIERLFEDLAEIHARLLEDAEAIFAGDPAAESIDEVIAAYPGFFAIATYRIAHCLYLQGVPVMPRLLSEYAHERTGVDIHPGATIGNSFFIDHATGIVIGETAVIGDHVKVYQGVTLGALSVSKEMRATRRHPTIGNRVVIYSNATILGGDTHIGDDTIIGGNAWITRDVPPRSVVYNRAEVRVRNLSDDEDSEPF
jgi:serine O-acetyltransferase